jgi:hypothetical protein
MESIAWFSKACITGKTSMIPPIARAHGKLCRSTNLWHKCKGLTVEQSLNQTPVTRSNSHDPAAMLKSFLLSGVIAGIRILPLGLLFSTISSLTFLDLKSMHRSKWMMD